MQMTGKTHNILYLVNPTANDGKAMDSWQEVRGYCKHASREPVDMTKISDLPSFLAEEKPQTIVIGGGDGTINAVCKAVLTLPKKPLLAVLPLGYGNAVSYCLGVETIQKACDVIHRRPATLTIDLFKTTVPQFPIGVFTMGVGVDGRIVDTTARYRYIGIRSYIISGIISVIQHVEKMLTLTIDKRVTISGTAAALAITNAPIIGKNVTQSDGAKLNDGLLNCILFSSNYAYFTNLRLRGFKHPLYSQREKMYFNAKHIRIEGDHYVQVDGDAMIHREPIDIEVLPKAVTFLRNDSTNIVLSPLPFIE